MRNSLTRVFRFFRAPLQGLSHHQPWSLYARRGLLSFRLHFQSGPRVRAFQVRDQFRLDVAHSQRRDSRAADVRNMVFPRWVTASQPGQQTQAG